VFYCIAGVVLDAGSDTPGGSGAAEAGIASGVGAGTSGFSVLGVGISFFSRVIQGFTDESFLLINPRNRLLASELTGSLVLMFPLLLKRS
jgi:hypothetical protein